MRTRDKRLETLEGALEALKAEVERLKAEPRRYEFHYHPPAHTAPYPAPYFPTWPYTPTYIWNTSDGAPLNSDSPILITRLLDGTVQ